MQGEGRGNMRESIWNHNLRPIDKHLAGPLYHPGPGRGLTQSLFALTSDCTAPTNCASGTGGMLSRSAPAAKRSAFLSGRNSTMRPLADSCAFMPSKMACP